MALKFGVIGLGVGRHHILNFPKNRDAEITHICDKDPKRLKQVQDEFHISNVETDYKKILANKDIDCVTIALPNFLHAPITIEALEAGKHVLCEKPMAMNAKQALDMKQAADKSGKILMLHMNQRYEDNTQFFKRVISEGNLGDIYMGRTGWHRNHGIPGLGGWFTTRDQSGGGPLIDLGVHKLDQAWYLMGLPKPITVSASVYNYMGTVEGQRQGKKYDVEDLACGFIRFDNGASMMLEVSWAGFSDAQDDVFIELRGTKGGLRYNNKYYQQRESVREVYLYEEKNGAVVESTVQYILAEKTSCLIEFISAIEEKRHPVSTAEQGVFMMKMLDAIYLSAKENREIRIADL